MAHLVLLATVVCAGALVFAAALSDLRTMRIPNGMPLAMLGLFAIAALAGPLTWPQIGWHVVFAAVVFVVSVGLFAAGMIGGGDAKLMPAVSLFLGPTAVSPFIFHTALAGGLFAVAVLALRRMPLSAGVRAQPLVSRLAAPTGAIPYGVAIAAGAFAAAPASPLVIAAFN